MPQQKEAFTKQFLFLFSVRHKKPKPRHSAIPVFLMLI